MGNGYTTEQVVDMIFKEVKNMHLKIDNIQTQVYSVVANGCAKREGDTVRIENMEKWVNRGIAGIIVSLVATVSAFIKVFFLSSK